MSVFIPMIFYTRLSVQHIIGYAIIRPFLIQFNVILPFLESILSPLIYLIEMQFVFFLSLSCSALPHVYCIGLPTVLAHSATQLKFFLSLHGFMTTFWGLFYTIRTLCDIWNEAMLLQIVFLFFVLVFFVLAMIFSSTHQRVHVNERRKKLRRKMTEKKLCFVLCRKGNEAALNVTIVCLPIVLWSHAFIWTSMELEWILWKWWKQNDRRRIFVALNLLQFSYECAQNTHASVD